ncbi:MAG: hypothetical protein KDD53_09535, partial [Bdellovibrionales bacterium]|nr:hypothetical protein [Bdellovibrionales bacterium]
MSLKSKKAKGPNILLLEPTEAFTEHFEQMLKRHDYSVVRVSAVEMLLEGTSPLVSGIDCAFIPLQLIGNQSGISACLKLRAS